MLGRELLPLGEGAGGHAVILCLALVVDVMARAPLAGAAVFGEHRLQLVEQVGLRAEMAEMAIALRLRLRHRALHAGAVEAVEGIAVDERRGDVLATKNLLERAAHRGGAGARGAGDGDDRMAR